MSQDKRAIDSLIESMRVRGQSRIITHDEPERVTEADARDVIELVNRYCQRKGLRQSHVSRSIGVGAGVLGQVLQMKHRGDWQSVILHLDRWLEDELKREAAPKPTEFVWTKVAEEILTVAEAVTALNCIGLVYDRFGSGIGKTMALQAILAEKPGSMLITIETASATHRGLLRLIAGALRLQVHPNAMSGPLFNAIKKAVGGTGRLLMIDELHKICGPDDRALHVLRDLHDAIGIPMLWCATTDIVAYLERKVAGGREPLAQIRRRIGIARDLRERVGDGAKPGEPLFSVEEIRRVFARSKMRLTPDAVRYLSLLANLPDSGGLGACRNLVVMATKVHEARADVLTADMLRAVHRLLVNREAFNELESRMEDQCRPIVQAAG